VITKRTIGSILLAACSLMLACIIITLPSSYAYAVDYGQLDYPEGCSGLDKCVHVYDIYGNLIVDSHGNGSLVVDVNTLNQGFTVDYRASAEANLYDTAIGLSDIDRNISIPFNLSRVYTDWISDGALGTIRTHLIEKWVPLAPFEPGNTVRFGFRSGPSDYLSLYIFASGEDKETVSEDVLPADENQPLSGSSTSSTSSENPTGSSGNASDTAGSGSTIIQPASASLGTVAAVGAASPGGGDAAQAIADALAGGGRLYEVISASQKDSGLDKAEDAAKLDGPVVMGIPYAVLTLICAVLFGAPLGFLVRLAHTRSSINATLISVSAVK